MGDTKIYSFDWPIKEIEVFVEKRLIVVLLKGDCYEKDSRNVFCVNKTGELLWQIPDVPLVTFKDGKSPYTRIVKEGNYVKAFNWDGTILKLEPSTGEIIDNHWTK